MASPDTSGSSTANPEYHNAVEGEENNIKITLWRW